MLEKLLFFSGRRADGAPPVGEIRLIFRAARRAIGAPGGAEIQSFQIFKFMKKLKNCFNKHTTWKSDQEEC